MTLGPDLILNVQTHDLELQNGDLVLDADVAQAVKIRLLFVRGEWFLNRLQGVPYYEQIFIKNVNLGHISALFRQTIIETPGVNEINEFTFEFDGATRLFTLTWAADTDQGEISEVTTFSGP